MNILNRSHQLILLGILFVGLVVSSCSTTKHLKEGEYLLKGNSIELESQEGISEKSELQDNLGSLVAQKPNSKFLSVIPYKLWLYNMRYEKYQKDEDNFQLKSNTVEKPVLLDTTYISKAKQNMEQFMFQKGYFYAQVSDTVLLKPKKKKATVVYNIKAGQSYLIKETTLQSDDSSIKHLAEAAQEKTVFKKGDHFSFGLVEQERARIVSLLRNEGYYYFSNDNLSFIADTLEKNLLKDVDNPFESAINFIATQKEKKRPTIDVNTIIEEGENEKSFKRYGIGKVIVYPDFKDEGDFTDSSMQEVEKHNITFRYHKYYIREKVIANHTFLQEGRYYSQKDYDKTVSELNQLGIFQSVRVVIQEDTTDGNWLTCYILMTPGDKYEVSTNWEVSSGTTYDLGSALTLSMSNKNFAKGANLLTVSLIGGVESALDTASNRPFLERFFLLSNSIGANASIEFPKFLLPITTKRYSIRNSPRTSIGIGISQFERISYFRMINISSRLTYKWRETITKNWQISPAFFNRINLPFKSDEFQQRLDENDYLENSYREVFIEGESAIWTFTDREKRNGKGYSYVQLGLEEAGGLMAGVNLLNSSLSGQYAQYIKLDFNLQQFFKARHSTLAFRFHGGVGIPYGQSGSLPYIKQYFVGGAYGMRGWPVRSLGPGNYFDTSSNNDLANDFIDRTGDIKLELNAEYRFEIIEVFAGVMMLHGALFADAGNIWLARSSTDNPGGEFQFNKFASDLAVNGGAGLRLDIAGFFLLRFDVAMKMKNPATNGTNGWVLKDIDPFYNTWRDKNLVLNFAIGYPF